MFLLPLLLLRAAAVIGRDAMCGALYVRAFACHLVPLVFFLAYGAEIAEMYNAPVAELKRQPSMLKKDLPFEPVTITFRYYYL